VQSAISPIHTRAVSDHFGNLNWLRWTRTCKKRTVRRVMHTRDPMCRVESSMYPPRLAAATFLVVAEPLDGPVLDGNVNWAADFGLGSVQTNFTTRFH
jgi:hypothetical protein